MLKIKRVNSSKPPQTLAEGEPVLTLKDNKLYIGDNKNIPRLVGEGTFLKIEDNVVQDYLTLNADPIEPMHAATKQYVDKACLYYLELSAGIVVNHDCVCIMDITNSTNNSEDILLADLSLAIEGKRITIKQIGEGRVYIIPSGTDTIDGETTLRLSANNQYITLVADPTRGRWYIIGGTAELT